MKDSVRCPFCLDLYTPENGLIPTHYLDDWKGMPKCAGSGIKPKELA